MATRRRRAPAKKPQRQEAARRKGSQARLRESEARFRSLTELSSDWFWEQDEQYRFTRLDGRHVRGGDPRARAQVLGTRCWDGELEVEGGWPAYRRRLEARERFHDLLMWRRTPAGEMRYVSISGEPVFHPKGRFAGYRGVGRDVTAQMRAEASLRESEARFRRTFELAGSGLAHVSLERRFLRVNRKLCEILGYPEQALLGRSVLEVSHPDDVAGVNAERERLYRGEIDSLRLEKRYLHSDGSSVWAALTLALERDPQGRPLYEIAVIDDITARKRDEQLLRLEHTVALLFSESSDASAAIRGALHAICTSEKWECGRYLHVDEAAGVLCAGEAWSAPEPAIERYVQSSRDMVYHRGVGLVGRVWDSGEPLWVPDISTDPRAARKTLAQETGMRGAFAVPVAMKGRIIGVFIFHSRALRQPDWRLLQTMQLIGSQIGQFLQRAQAERAMRESEARFRSLTELSSDWYWEQDEHYRFTRLEGRNVAGGDRAVRERLIGSTRWESGLQIEGGWDAHRALLEARQPFVDVLMWRRLADGSLRYVSVSGEPLFAADGRFAGYRGVGRDITPVRRAAEALRESEARFRALTEMSSDFYWETDAQHRLTDMTYGRGAIGRMDEALGRTAWEVASTHPDPAGWARLRAKVDAHQPFRDFEFGRPRRGGGVRYFSVSGEPRFAADGSFVGYRGVGREITDIVLARERIASLAFQDPLTGLGNRASLAPALEQAVERTRRRGSKLAGVFLDLDGFKRINDLHGHDAGDRLLAEAAQRLRAALRSADPVARLGGDEFFVVLEDLQSAVPAERVARKLLEVLREAFDLGEGRRASISASIGISLFPDDAGDAATLMKHADRAMYAAKEAGKNAYRFYAGAD